MDNWFIQISLWQDSYYHVNLPLWEIIFTNKLEVSYEQPKKYKSNNNQEKIFKPCHIIVIFKKRSTNCYFYRCFILKTKHFHLACSIMWLLRYAELRYLFLQGITSVDMALLNKFLLHTLTVADTCLFIKKKNKKLHFCEVSITLLFNWFW